MRFSRPTRSESGGRVELTSGASNFNIKNIVRGTVKFKRVHVEAIPVMDRGSYATVLEGDDTLAEVEVEVHFVGGTTNQLVDLADDRDGTTNAKKLWTIDLYFPTYKGASAGIKQTFTNGWFDEAPQYQAGDQTDKLSLKFKATTNAQLAAY